MFTKTGFYQTHRLRRITQEQKQRQLFKTINTRDSNLRQTTINNFCKWRRTRKYHFLWFRDHLGNWQFQNTPGTSEPCSLPAVYSSLHWKTSKAFNWKHSGHIFWNVNVINNKYNLHLNMNISYVQWLYI